MDHTRLVKDYLLAVKAAVHLQLHSQTSIFLAGCVLLSAVFLAVIRLWPLVGSPGRKPRPQWKHGSGSKTSTANIDVSSMLPPSRRHVLEQLAVAGVAGVAAAVPPNAPVTRPLATTRSVSVEANGNSFSPTGFSMREIRDTIGWFPDYAILSGVPHPQPCGSSYTIDRAKFRPFRPFRWRYHQNMDLMKLDPDYWLELEQNYQDSMVTRQKLLAQHRDRIFFQEPGSELACHELMQMVVQFLCHRYPAYFVLEEDTASGDKVLVNRLLDTRVRVGGAGTAGTCLDAPAVDALQIIFDHVPEDFAVMLRSEHDGRYYLRAAAVCSSVGWDVAEHRNRPLRAIHTQVPDYAARMAFSMDRYFARLPTDKPVQRCSWSIEDWEPLFSSPHVDAHWQRSAFADNDDGRRPPPNSLSADHLRLRCDWQTLRRLPLTGAVVFNFKACTTPLVELRTEPFVPALLHCVLRHADAHLLPSKCMPHTRPVAIAALEEWAAEQVRQGVVPADWDVRTLDESPFYPGWKERWLAAQGF